MITKTDVAKQLLKYLNKKITLQELVDWAEQAMAQGTIDPEFANTLMKILGKIAAADVKEFGLLWEDCESIMKELGFKLTVDASFAA